MQKVGERGMRGWAPNLDNRDSEKFQTLPFQIRRLSHSGTNFDLCSFCLPQFRFLCCDVLFTPFIEAISWHKQAYHWEDDRCMKIRNRTPFQQRTHTHQMEDCSRLNLHHFLTGGENWSTWRQPMKGPEPIIQAYNHQIAQNKWPHSAL